MTSLLEPSAKLKNVVKKKTYSKSKGGPAWTAIRHALPSRTNRGVAKQYPDCTSILQNLKYSVRPPFYNENRYIVYVSFDFCNGHNCFYKLCVVDTKEEKFYIKKIINPDFKEDVNYTFSTRDSFEDLTNDYYHYYFDIKMDVSNFIVEGPEISSEG